MNLGRSFMRSIDREMSFWWSEQRRLAREELAARDQDGTRIQEALMSKDEKVDALRAEFEAFRNLVHAARTYLRMRMESCERAIAGIRACSVPTGTRWVAGEAGGVPYPLPPPRDHSSCCGDGPLPLTPTEEASQLRHRVRALENTRLYHKGIIDGQAETIQKLKCRLRCNGLPDSVPE